MIEFILAVMATSCLTALVLDKLDPEGSAAEHHFKEWKKSRDLVLREARKDALNKALKIEREIKRGRM